MAEKKANGNLSIYEQVRAVPKEAQKGIGGGRLKGMTDINPMWRIKTLTEHFGPVGIGWYTEVIEQWLENGGKDEVMAFVKIHLYVKHDGEWSKPIVGYGGSSFISNEKNGLYTNDECFKMAYTDAISVSCKALGIGADVYWGNDTTKYIYQEDKETTNETTPENDSNLSEKQIKRLFAIAHSKGIDADTVKEQVKKKLNKDIKGLTKEEYDRVCSGYEGLKGES